MSALSNTKNINLPPKIYYPRWCNALLSLCVDSRNVGKERVLPSEKEFCRNQKGQGLYKSEEQEW
jgi:hypothetical protein